MHKSILLLTAMLLVIPTINGLTMGENKNTLPAGCDDLSGHHNFTVSAGRIYAANHTGVAYTYDKREFNVEPCSKVTVTFNNTDEIRHQWMIHGLSKSIHNMGMMTISADGGETQTGTFIAPSYDETLLVHCGIAQHQQKGMKAQLKVGTGDGSIPNIIGERGSWTSYAYPQRSLSTDVKTMLTFFGMMLSTLLVGIVFRLRYG